MRSFAVCALLSFLAIPGAGLEPYLVKDIDPVPHPASSAPEDLVALGGAVLFRGNDGVGGVELWRSDGTVPGTFPLTDFCGEIGCSGAAQPYFATERLYFFQGPSGDPGPDPPSLWVTDGTAAGTFRLTGSGVRILSHRIWSPSQGVLYFVAEDLDHGAEPWRTDGTPAGTWMLADVRTGFAGSDVSGLVEYRGRIWFGADDGQRGGALWATDGTPAGTALAVDPAPSSASHPVPRFPRVLGSRLTFFAATPGKGERLWAGDGTAKRTAPVTTGKTPLLFRSSVVHGNRLYFVGEDGRKGQELWVSDGTAKGTRVLTSFRKKDPFFSFEHELGLTGLRNLRDRFVFWANDGARGIEPWVTDGTPRGTRLLRDVCPGPCHAEGILWTEVNGRLYFGARDLEHGYEPWTTDGTAAGTRLLRDVCPGSRGSNAFAPFPVNGGLVFVADDGQQGQEVWSTDGTTAGTIRVSAFERDQRWAPFQGAVANGRLFFTAEEPSYGDELWLTDGTVAGTRLAHDLNQADVGGSQPHWLHAFGNEAVFFAFGHEPGLWKSDGTAAGTSRIRAFDPAEVATDPLAETAVAGGRLFFPLRQSEGTFLWRTDGTEAGTFLLAGERLRDRQIRAAGDRVFFVARQDGQGDELWASDGTVEGTGQVRDVHPGHLSSNPGGLTAFQGKVYFSAEGESSGRELWTSDGTEAGTFQVKEIHPHDSADPAALTLHAGRLWFFANDGEHGRELWSSDGTEAGTRLEAELAAGPESFDVDRMASVGGRLVISGFSRAEGESGLWVSDGTEAGTGKISERHAAVGGDWTVFQDRLYFGVSDLGSESLWVSDGTEAGTGPFLDREGEQVRDVGPLVALGGRLFFKTRGFGVPLWVSDGTSAGTYRLLPVTDPATNDPSELVRAGSRLFFPRYDRLTGMELWAIE